MWGDGAFLGDQGAVTGRPFSCHPARCHLLGNRRAGPDHGAHRETAPGWFCPATGSLGVAATEPLGVTEERGSPQGKARNTRTQRGRATAESRTGHLRGRWPPPGGGHSQGRPTGASGCRDGRPRPEATGRAPLPGPGGSAPAEGGGGQERRRSVGRAGGGLPGNTTVGEEPLNREGKAGAEAGAEAVLHF